LTSDNMAWCSTSRTCWVEPVTYLHTTSLVRYYFFGWIRVDVKVISKLFSPDKYTFFLNKTCCVALYWYCCNDWVQNFWSLFTLEQLRRIARRSPAWALCCVCVYRSETTYTAQLWASY